ncbi:hypothetical protein GCM10009120_32010 [Sphingobacterium siyangense subsp. cladoniae]
MSALYKVFVGVLEMVGGDTVYPLSLMGAAILISSLVVSVNSVDSVVSEFRQLAKSIVALRDMNKNLFIVVFFNMCFG